jgi:eukaryotic-like serine/threonine-protein kinase
MEAERLKQIEEIYHAALEIAPAERFSFLIKVCGEDEDLRGEVESLLAVQISSDNLFDASPESLAAEMFFEQRKEPAANLTGKEISHYKIERLLGQGGMGAVYLASDTKLDRPVALKILPPEFAGVKERMSRFVREAKSASALNHPNIITIYEINEAGGTHFIAEEFIDGKTLNQHVKRNSLDFESVLKIAIQIASALDEAHSAGIVHRDIKPDNMMVRPNGLVKIVDFGIAKLLAAPQSNAEAAGAAAASKSVTKPGTIIGTVSYMSPEQARGEKVDARSDIFSFGVVLYEMISGALPFEGETATEMLGAILKDEPKPLNKTQVPAAMEKIIGKCLRKDRNKRYQTIKDALVDLLDLKQELEFRNKLKRTAAPDRPEAKTQIQRATTVDEINRTTANQTVAGGGSGGPKKSYSAVGLTVVLLCAIGFSAYFYFNSSQQQIKSIAVLPFVNVNDGGGSGDRDREYLSDGLSENLINIFSRLPQLKVIASSSSFKFRGENVNVQEAAKKLGVAAILTGRIARRGDDLQISVELIDPADNTRLWGDIYNRKDSGVLSVPEEIARAVSEKLRLKLSGAQERQIAKRMTNNPQAYQSYLNGVFYRRKNGAENNRKAIEYQNRAIALDENFAAAYTELSNNFAALVEIGALNPKEGMPQARAAAEKALALDETLAEAHDALAGVRYFEFDWTGAESAFKRAIELNPNLAAAHSFYANYLSRSGRFDEALREIRLAQELDPLKTGLIGNEAAFLYHARRYDESLALQKRLITQSPADNAFFYLVLANIYVQKGQYAEAILSYQTSLQLEETSSALIYLGRVYALSGRRGDAAAILDKLKTTEKYVSPAELAILYAALGEREKAFASLEKAYTERDFQLTSLKVEPGYDALRGDPRFQDLIKRNGFPQ